ncbi:MAG TPA: hypothetical protein VMX13_12645 [Sedimentisphaerales bacterium]|nr:hypothetical protein [Sedimentisphaerales bacterium]
MKARKNLVAGLAGLLACGAVLVWASTTTGGREEIYEVRPEVAIPEYRTDAARAIDAYERLMERYLDLTEGNLLRLGTDVQRMLNKLDSIEHELTGLSARMERIEKSFGIEQAHAANQKDAPPQTAKKSSAEKP